MLIMLVLSILSYVGIFVILPHPLTEELSILSITGNSNKSAIFVFDGLIAFTPPLSEIEGKSLFPLSNGIDFCFTFIIPVDKGFFSILLDFVIIILSEFASTPNNGLLL